MKSEISNLLDLPLFTAAAADPNVITFTDLLRAAPDWLTAAQCLAALNLPVTEANKRLTRAWAEASDGDIISGQRGYRHARKATPDEIAHAANWLDHQGDRMKLRAHKIRRHAHATIG